MNGAASSDPNGIYWPKYYGALNGSEKTQTHFLYRNKAMEMNTIGAVALYIELHEKHLGYPPTAVGLPYQNYIAVVKEMGGDGRCTNLQASIKGVRLFCL
jgi:hypothetical protein